MYALAHTGAYIILYPPDDLYRLVFILDGLNDQS